MRSLPILLLFTLAQAQAQPHTVTYAFVGSYTEGQPDEGLHVLRLNAAGDRLEPVWHGEGLVNPSFVQLSPDGRTLYACTESKTPDNGHVRAFAVDSLTGALRELNAQPSGGDNPVYIAIHPAGHWLVVANYTGSSITVYPLRADGAIASAAQHLPFTDAGSGRVPDRQEASHMHAAVFAPDGTHLYVPDLGCDRIRAFAFNAATVQPLEEQSSLDVLCAPGSGPRHLVFSPNARMAYCVEEMGGTLAVYRVEGARLVFVQRLPTYATVPAVGSSADVHVSPDGNYVYVSNRAPEHSLAVFAMDSANESLALVAHQPVLGTTPRSFGLSPDGRLLSVANGGTGQVVLFRCDASTGALEPLSNTDIPRASSVVWRTYAAGAR